MPTLLNDVLTTQPGPAREPDRVERAPCPPQANRPADQAYDSYRLEAAWLLLERLLVGLGRCCSCCRAAQQPDERADHDRLCSSSYRLR